MYIHTVKEGETVYSIAEKYGVSPSKIIENNLIAQPSKLIVGEELLILVPTRTYSVRNGDSLEEVCKRFAISKEDIRKNNPYLVGRDKLFAEEILAIKYPPQKRGLALLNGYVYKGCSEEKIYSTLPYLSHLTLSSHTYQNGKLKRIFEPKRAIEIAKESGKATMLRVFCTEEFSKDLFSSDLSAALISETNKFNCEGITVAFPSAVKSAQASEFFMKLKQTAIENGIALFLEVGEDADTKCTEAADALILNYDKIAFFPSLSFEDGERRFYTDFSEKFESLKTFADISPFAYDNKKAITYEDAREVALRKGCKYEHDDTIMISSIKYREKGEACCILSPSLKNLKARLDLCGELGYLGFSIDVLRCPTAFLMMISQCFQTAPNYFCGGM